MPYRLDQYYGLLLLGIVFAGIQCVVLFVGCTAGIFINSHLKWRSIYTIRCCFRIITEMRINYYFTCNFLMKNRVCYESPD